MVAPAHLGLMVRLVTPPLPTTPDSLRDRSISQCGSRPPGATPCGVRPGLAAGDGALGASLCEDLTKPLDYPTQPQRVHAARLRQHGACAASAPSNPSGKSTNHTGWTGVDGLGGGTTDGAWRFAGRERPATLGSTDGHARSTAPSMSRRPQARGSDVGRLASHRAPLNLPLRDSIRLTGQALAEHAAAQQCRCRLGDPSTRAPAALSAPPEAPGGRL